MRTSSASTTGQIAIALAFVTIVGLAFIILFYALLKHSGSPFGMLNDVCVALGGLLSGGLAWKLYPTYYSHAGRESRFALICALIGAGLVPVGSVLLLFNITSWFLAGLIIAFGYAMIGLWLVGLNYSALNWYAFPRMLAQYGMITGWIMMIGMFTAPGILAGMDAMKAAPRFILIALFIGSLGWSVFYTIWCIGLGYLLLINT